MTKVELKNLEPEEIVIYKNKSLKVRQINIIQYNKQHIPTLDLFSYEYCYRYDVPF